jgi:hypothetical protein
MADLRSGIGPREEDTMVNPIAGAGAQPVWATKLATMAAASQATTPPAGVSFVASPDDAVTISRTARLQAAVSATGSAAGGMAAALAPAAQTSTRLYVASVTAALARNPGDSVQQIMASLGVPQSEQQHVAAALGPSAVPLSRPAEAKAWAT